MCMSNKMNLSRQRTKNYAEIRTRTNNFILTIKVDDATYTTNQISYYLCIKFFAFLSLTSPKRNPEKFAFSALIEGLI